MAVHLRVLALPVDRRPFWRVVLQLLPLLLVLVLVPLPLLVLVLVLVVLLLPLLVLVLVRRCCQLTTPDGRLYQSLAHLSAALLWPWQPRTVLVSSCPPPAVTTR